MSGLVTIERKKLDPNRAFGIIIAQSPALTLVHREHNFQFDGYWVCRTKDITLCESPDCNAYWLRLMRREGLWEAVPRWIKRLSTDGWRELITDLVGTVVILEDEVRGDFHIGPILEAQAKHVAYHCFDLFGRLQDVEKVPYSRITSMQFGNRYNTIYAKYLTCDGQPIASTHSNRRPKRKRSRRVGPNSRDWDEATTGEAAVGEMGEELKHFALEAVEAALAAFPGDELHVRVFFVDTKGQAHTIAIAPDECSDGSDLVDVARHTVAEEIGQLAHRYALAYDGYLTTDGERSDAVFVEAGERGQPEAFLIAQRYRATKRSRKIERVGPPTVIEAAEPLLG